MFAFSKIVKSVLNDNYDVACANSALAGNIHAPLWHDINTLLQQSWTSKATPTTQISLPCSSDAAGNVKTPSLDQVKRGLKAFFETENLPIKKAIGSKIAEALATAVAMVNEAHPGQLPAYTCPVWLSEREITVEQVIEKARKDEAKAALKMQKTNDGITLQNVVSALNKFDHEQLRQIMQACEVQLEALGYEAVFEPALL
jgi:hypothetical protein